MAAPLVGITTEGQAVDIESPSWIFTPAITPDLEVGVGYPALRLIQDLLQADPYFQPQAKEVARFLITQIIQDKIQYLVLS